MLNNCLWFIERTWETVFKPFTMKICEVIWIFTNYLWKTGSWKREVSFFAEFTLNRVFILFSQVLVCICNLLPLSCSNHVFYWKCSIPFVINRNNRGFDSKQHNIHRCFNRGFDSTQHNIHRCFNRDFDSTQHNIHRCFKYVWQHISCVSDVLYISVSGDKLLRFINSSYFIKTFNFELELEINTCVFILHLKLMNS